MEINIHSMETKGNSMSSRVQIGELSIATPIVQFVSEALQDTGIEADSFWHGTEEIIRDLAPRNRTLLARRDEIQAKLDEYHFANPGKPEPVIYREFLTDIGYIVDEPTDFNITTSNVDSEIALQAGPQLIVPLLNARFSTNAANARWGSLYDAFYGTDVIEEGGELARGVGYNPLRGAEVVRRGRALLDDAVPLASGSHADAQSYTVTAEGLTVKQSSGAITSLADPGQFVGYAGPADAPSSVVMIHNGLHIEVQTDPTHPIGRLDSAGVKDIVIESALTSIMDLEDSVAAVDAEDKALGYRNWLHLSQGTLTAAVPKGDQTFTRSMNSDKTFSTLDGGSVTLRGRALMLIRNVGHLMTTDAVLDSVGNETPEGILDAIMTALGSIHDINGHSRLSNSRTGAMYIVKPKMHGPEEVAFTVELFRRVEGLLGLKPLTLKLGIMDEERRTTINLKACIEVAKDRVVFINTGFLDRTGDEIHTSLLAGPMVRKADLKSQRFIQAYEDFNVDTGLATGFQHRAQIGKGMWAMPNLMAAMLQQKSGHPAAGANTAWVPSPTAATLHSLHYHGVNVFEIQDALKKRASAGIDAILEIPLASNVNWSRDEIATETDNNVQSILGYVVRWVDQGIGCSTVPDINNVGLMEDRATLRISSQLLANWLEHGIITEDDVTKSMYRIAPVVDSQNADDPLYEPLVGADGPGLAFNAARDLVLLGGCQPNGYTEPILHRARRAKKALRS